MGTEVENADALAQVKEAVEKIRSEELTVAEASEKYSIEEAILTAFVAEEVQGEKLKDAPKTTGYDDGSEEDDNPKVEGKEALGKGNTGNEKKADVKENVELKSNVTREDIAIDVKEHLDAFFKGDEDLSEDFKTKVKTIFETAVIATSQKVISENIAKLQENFDARLEEKVLSLEENTEAYKVELDEKLNEYLAYVVEDWAQNNKPAIQSTVRSELTESFIVGLKALFEDHYIDIPAEKANIVEDFATKLQESENELEKVIQENARLKKEKSEILKESLIDKASHGLSENQKDKFTALVENVEFNNSEAFEKSLSTIRESYFENSTTNVTGVEDDDTPLEGLEEEAKIANVKEVTQASYTADVMKRFLRK